MKIDHLAIWVRDLEIMKNFYEKYFQATSGPKYSNPTKKFTSYFLGFGNDKTRLEFMHNPEIKINSERRGFTMGMAHFAVSLGSKDKVNALTEQLRADGFTIASEPRTTGDGYYESVVLDPEGNYVEITA